MELYKGLRVLAGKVNRYDNIHVPYPPLLPTTEFSKILDDSITAWNEQNYKAAWIKLKKKHSEYIPLLLDNGFDFHNAWYDRVTL